LPDYPTVRTGRHEHNIARDYVLLLNGVPSIQHLPLKVGVVLKLDQVSFRSIKNHNELVILIYVSLAETGFLLTGHRFLQPSFRFVNGPSSGSEVLNSRAWVILAQAKR
jgi:hypothetical protein